MATDKPRIILIDDEPMFHEFLRELFEGHEVEFTSCTTGGDGLHELKTRVFDLVLVDYQLTDMLGTEILDWMRKREMDTPCVLVTGFATVEVAVEAMKLGASDVFTKPLTDPPAFIRFLNRTVSFSPPLPLPRTQSAPPQAVPSAPMGASATEAPRSGELPASPRQIQALCQRLDPPVFLSAREREVLPELLKGLSNKEIASELFISERTVKNHISHIYRKFAVESRAQLFNMILGAM